MQAVAKSAFNAVQNCQIHSVVEGELLVGDVAAYLIRTGAEVEPADEEAEALVDELAQPAVEVEPADEEAEALDITASIPEILAWVGDDPATRPDRALIAWEAETARGDKARSTLLAQLTDIVEN